MLSNLLILPVVAGFISQIAKFFFKSNNCKISLKHFLSYSGMPSSHSAIVVSLVTAVWIYEGIASPLFAVSFILAIIVIRDALGIRSYLGEHSHVINLLIKELKDDELLVKKYPHLLERIGHTPAQVIVGSLLGFFISLIGAYIL